MSSLKSVSVIYAALSGLAVLYALGAMVYVAMNRTTGDFINLRLEEIAAFVGLTILAIVAGIGLLGAVTAAALALAKQRELGWWLALCGLFTVELIGAGLAWLIVPSL